MLPMLERLIQPLFLPRLSITERRFLLVDAAASSLLLLEGWRSWIRSINVMSIISCSSVDCRLVLSCLTTTQLKMQANQKLSPLNPGEVMVIRKVRDFPYNMINFWDLPYNMITFWTLSNKQTGHRECHDALHPLLSIWQDEDRWPRHTSPIT
jgi:hypothetical protein